MRKGILLLAACLLLSGCAAKNVTRQEENGNTAQAEETAILENKLEIPLTNEKIPEETPTLEETDTPKTDAPETDGGEPVDPWRTTYAAFLEKRAVEAAWVRNPENPEYDPSSAASLAADTIDSYFLYDIDKDGVPELLMCCGDGIHTTVYGYAEGAVTELGDVSSSHSSFYTWPGENAVAIRWSHMGGLCLRKLTLSEGILTEEWVYEEFADLPDEQFTPMEDLIPGTLWLQPAHPTVTLPEYGAMVLPVYRYGKETVPVPLDPARDGEAKARIEAVLTGGGEFYGVAADEWGGYNVATDRFGGDTGLTTLEDYLRPGGVSLYAELPLVVTDREWLDCNGDGRSEALVSIAYAEGDRSYGSGFAVLFSLEEDGRVYAYCVSHATDCRWDGEGFVSGHHETPFAIAFDLEQAYLYTPGQEMP